MTVRFLLLFLTMPWVCLQCVIVEFLDHTHLLFSSGCSLFAYIIQNVMGLRNASFNPFTCMPNGISHPYQLEQSVPVIRNAGWYSPFFIQILIEQSASKQWRP